MKPSLRVISALLCFSGVFPTPAVAKVPGEVAALVKSHCVECHSGSKPEAGLNLKQLKFDLADRHAFATWVRVHDKLEAGEMPPPDEDQPSPDERSA